MTRRPAWCAVLAVLILNVRTDSESPWPVRFTDVAEIAGLVHTSVYGES
jgi:hypothetical protein